MTYSYRKVIEQHHQKNILVGTALISVAIVLLGISFGLLFASQSLFSFGLAAGALGIGSLAFASFRNAYRPPEISLTVLEIPRFEAKFRDGRTVAVYLEFRFFCQHQFPYAQDRIKASVQRILGSYLFKRRDISEDAYSEIDQLFQSEIPSLSEELGLEELALRTVDVEILDAN